MNKTPLWVWEEKLKTVGERVDTNGRKMDLGIIETVAALNLLKIPTSGSCEGHLDYGLPNPWVDIVAMNRPETQFLEKEETPEYKKWQKENKILNETVATWIIEFYTDSKPDEQIKILIRLIGRIAGRIQSGEGTSTKSVEILRDRQVEIKKFSKFLKKKFEISING